MKSPRTYYFSDELNDEFSGIERDTITVDKNYKFIHKSIFWRIASFVVLRLVMTPVAFLYLKIKFHCRFVGREKFKRHMKDGFFLYGNHTQAPGDGYIPVISTFPKRDTVIVNADNVSLKGTRTFMEFIGAYPLPTALSGMRGFLAGLEYVNKKGNCTVIYPEAHIWPYYTGIRPFKDDSFEYPIKYSKAVYCETTTYTRRKNSDKADMTIYIDGPFYADAALCNKAARKKLRDEVYQAMCRRATYSTYEYNRYVRKEHSDD